MQISKEQALNALNALISAAIGGACVAVGDSILEQKIDYPHLKTVAIIGALYGITQHYRTPPTVRAQQAMLLQQTPAGQVAQAENAVVGAVAAKVEAEANQVAQEATSPPKGE